MMTMNDVRRSGILAALTIAAAGFSDAQVVRGEQVTVLGTTYEVVSFEFRSLNGTGLYEILAPASVELQEQEVGGTVYTSTLIGGTINIGTCPSQWAVFEPDIEFEIDGFSAAAGSGQYDVTMSHTYHVADWMEEEMGWNQVSSSPYIWVHIKIAEETCISTFFSSAFGDNIDEGVSRGVHQMAEEMPTLRAWEEATAQLQSLLSYIGIRRVR